MMASDDFIRDLPLGVYRVSMDGSLIQANAATIELIGAAASSAEPARFSWSFAHPSDYDAMLRRLRAEGRIDRWRVRMRREDGSLFWAEHHAALVSDETGRAAGFGGVFQDLTTVVEAEDERNEALRSMEMMITHTPAVAIQIYDRTGIVQLWNPASESIYGFTAEEMLGRRVGGTFLPPAEAAVFEGIIARMAEEQQPLAPSEWTVRRKDGTSRHVFATIFPLSQGERVCCMDVDITERKRAEEALQNSEERHRLLFERNLAGVFRSDMTGRVLECNEAMARTFGYASREEMLGTSAWSLYFDPADREKMLEELRLKGQLTNYEMRLRKKDASGIWILENVTVVNGDQIMEGTLIDITQRKEAEQLIEFQAWHDALTGLPNASLFKDRLELALAHAARHGSVLSVMFLDLDRFKTINDTLGHAVGDELLGQVGNRLTDLLRKEDTIARLGGDEFILLLEITSSTDAVMVAEKILETVNRPFIVGSREIFVSTSIGIALYPGDGTDAGTLMKNADAAMYRAKEEGRNDYRLCSPVAGKRPMQRLELENALRRAVERDELVLFYQPQLSLGTGRIVGVEALIRWRHADRGLLAPAEFIPLAEESGLIISIGEWAIHTACAEAKRLFHSNAGPLRVAMNLSAKQFQQRNLARILGDCFSRAGLPFGWLDVEITESAAMSDPEITTSVLHQLREIGFRISLDDFGTGHASLHYLKKFPIDALKIDLMFIQDLMIDASDAAIVQAVIAMAKALGLQVIAEGVETREQLNFLSAAGCHEIQGYLFSRPVPVETLEEMLTAGMTLEDAANV